MVRGRRIQLVVLSGRGSRSGKGNDSGSGTDSGSGSDSDNLLEVVVVGVAVVIVQYM